MHDIPDVIDELVTATAPRAAVADADEAFDALVARLMRSPVEQRSRSRMRRAVGVTAVAVVAVAVPAAAMWAPLRTGLFGGAGDTENDRTEFLQSASGPYASTPARPPTGPVGYSFNAATPMMGMLGGDAPSDPANGLSEKLKMPPSAATIR